MITVKLDVKESVNVDLEDKASSTTASELVSHLKDKFQLHLEEWQLTDIEQNRTLQDDEILTDGRAYYLSTGRADSYDPASHP